MVVVSLPNQSLGERRKQIIDPLIAESKVVKDQIANLKVEKESITTQIIQETKNLESIRKEFDEISKSIEISSKQISEFIVAAKLLVSDYANLIGEYRKVIEEVQPVFSGIDNKILEAKKEIEVIKQDGKQAHAVIVSETKKLDVMRADLNVYKNRIEQEHFKLFGKPLIL